MDNQIIATTEKKITKTSSYTMNEKVAINKKIKSCGGGESLVVKMERGNNQ